MTLGAIAACGELEPRASSQDCNGCLPACVADLDPDDLSGTAERLGCDPELVERVQPRPGSVSRERTPEVAIDLRHPARSDASGSGCDGPIRLQRVGPVGRIPEQVAADIISHASLNSLPVWPHERECVDASWSVEGTRIRLLPREPLERFVWYEVVVPETLALQGARLCSDLIWRFTVSACGNGVIDRADELVDWVCLGKVEAERGWFDFYSEDCDDGNLDAHDGCSHLCVHETGWTCDERGCHTRCGDGIRAGDEQCDFGIVQPEGCDDHCRIASGYECEEGGCKPSRQKR